MIITDVNSGISRHKKKKRVGRGMGSGHGKTCGHGHKGYFSRAGSSRRLSFEGGQMPLARRIAKRGFNNKVFATDVAVVNLGSLDTAFADGDEVTPEALVAKGLIKSRFDELKILGDGGLTKKLTVNAHRFSKSAEDKIAGAGGTAVLITQ